jgi:Leucine-rich repeat (LRR) protein
MIINENEISFLPETLIDLNSLVKIDLEGNKLKKLPNNLILIPSLKYINIARNKSLELTAEQKRFIKKRDDEVY